MLYSRFDATRGLYDVFEDAVTRPVNADLPVPRLGAVVGGIGVPASEAGRPLPAGAKHVGESWHAKGLIVSPGQGGSLSGMGSGSLTVLGVVIVAVSAVGSYALYMRRAHG
jgi:hypothetical protein